MSFRAFFLNLLALASLNCIPHCVAVSSGVTPDGEQWIVDAHGTYMRATWATDGSIIGVYEDTDGPKAVIRVVKSTNSGISWQAIGSVTSVVTETHSIGNPFILQLPNGRLLATSRNHDRKSAHDYTYFRIALFGSDDGGANWSSLGNIAERRRDGINGLWEPFLRVSRNGTIQAFYSSENNAYDQDNIMKISKDNGESWSSPMPVSGQDIRSRDGMTGVANVDDEGNVICVFESLRNNVFSIDYVLSDDDGFTWPSRGRLYKAKNNRDAGAPQIVNVGGTLVADFMSNEDVDPRNGNYVDGGQMKVVTSTNGGLIWSDPVVTGTKGSHWPGLFSLDDSHFLGLWQQDPEGLVSQKFRLAKP
ncbi:hypothetical protein TOPH_08448 [Tolypocladium ophioglossoides CBS 100239]|uniref:Sialidase domain-containing protein n=1 Tax=Tolypocladium ophioglossoides (strain CBS 100239) TaxID=1163406 RepID=A0A0L0MZH0_TOLOC|nr:hypothetical protein TOPH_08448 [Tolypocladium ophioglossoides CBS 100239]